MRNWTRGQCFPSSRAFAPCPGSHQVADDIDVHLEIFGGDVCLQMALGLAATVGNHSIPSPKDTDMSKTTPAWNKALVLEAFELVPPTQV